MFRFLRSFLTVLFVGCIACSSAQIVQRPREPEINVDSLRREFDKGPNFGAYKDNYFIFGPSIGPKATKANTNVKFQISVAQKLTNTTLPWGTYFYLFYTQKVIWNVLQNSMPMVDLNFNPGLGFTKPLFRNNRYIGKVSLIFEHESNGRDSIQSRSWERISFAGNFLLTSNLNLHAKIWIPIVDGENNKDLLRYAGLGQVGLSYMTTNRRFGCAVNFVKLNTWKPDFNSVIEVSWKPFPRANQYLFLQYYNGYGECMLNYKQFVSNLRIGICIKPNLFTDF